MDWGVVTMTDDPVSAFTGAEIRPVEPQVMEWAYRGGLVAILALMLFVTFNDLGAFGVWRSLAGLIG